MRIPSRPLAAFLAVSALGMPLAADDCRLRDLGPDGRHAQSVRSNPSDRSRLWALDWYGFAMFESRDGGASWSDSVLTGELRADSLAFTPDPNWLYAAGEAGVLRSTDGGATWAPRRSGLATERGAYGIAVDGADPKILYTGQEGLYRSTNGGSTWGRLPMPQNILVEVLATHPSQGGVLFAWLVGAGTTQPGLHVSRDGGKTFLPSQAGVSLDSPQLAMSKEWGDSVLAVERGGLFRSVDGSSWKAVAVSGWATAVTERDGVFHVLTTAGLFESGDGGKTFEPIAGVPSVTGPTGLAWGSDGLVASTEWEGFHLFRDGRWEDSNAGFGSVVWGIAACGSGRLLAGTMRGVVRAGSSGRFGPAVLPPNERVGWVICTGERSAAAVGLDEVFRTSDDGETWKRTPVSTGGRWTGVSVGLGGEWYVGGEKGLYVSSDAGATFELRNETCEFQVVVAHPAVPGSLLAGTWHDRELGRRGLRVSRDGGITFDPAQPDLRGDYVEQIEISHADVRRVAAIAGGLYLSSDSGANFVSASGELGSRAWCVEADPVDPLRWWAGGTRGLFRSTDGGTTWELVLETEREVRSLDLDPQDRWRVYLGTAAGAFTYRDARPGAGFGGCAGPEL